MRRLAQPQVVTSAAIAAALSALLSLPRMLLWEKRTLPVSYLEAMIFFCGFVLWAFVFAWHTEYTHRPIFMWRIKPSVFAIGTLVGITGAIIYHWLIDPTQKIWSPQDYPADFKHWVATTLFALALAQLLLLFAPFAWLMRLFRNVKVATWGTVAMGVLLLALKANASPTPLPVSLLLELLIYRIAFTWLAVWFYLRGGILLIWWIGFLIEARHLITFGGY